MKRILALILSCALAGAAACAPASAPPFTLADTEVLDLHAHALQRDYQLYIALPESYRSSNKRYPVIFVTDANYGFPVVRAIADRLHKHAHLEEAIVVGLSYAKGDSPTTSRRRDYTPTTPRAGGYTSDMPRSCSRMACAPICGANPEDALRNSRACGWSAPRRASL
jgi:hypothetical protein